MQFARVTVEVDGRILESIVKLGTMASIQVGSQEGEPEHRITIFSGEKADGALAAWIQIVAFNERGPQLVHEGWAGTDASASSQFGSLRATLERLENVSLAGKSLLEAAEFGLTGCCTSTGTNGRTIRCCNCCCSDPVGAPGAHCCA